MSSFCNVTILTHYLYSLTTNPTALIFDFKAFVMISPFCSPRAVKQMTIRYNNEIFCFEDEDLLTLVQLEPVQHLLTFRRPTES